MSEQVLRECIWALESIAQDLHEMKEHTVKRDVAEEAAPGGWVGVANSGVLPRDRFTDASCTEDVLIGTDRNEIGGGRIFVIGWGYYSYVYDQWYIACGEGFPSKYRPTRERVTHFLRVPQFAEE